MTVAQLIDKLRYYPQAATVVLEVGGDGAIHEGVCQSVDPHNEERDVVTLSAEIN